MRNKYRAVSAYSLITPNYVPSFDPSFDNTRPYNPVEPNLEISTFAQANAVINFIKSL